MAKRLENPDEDDLGKGAVELEPQEFEALLSALETCGIEKETIDRARSAGFIAPIERGAETEPIFVWFRMHPT